VRRDGCESSSISRDGTGAFSRGMMLRETTPQDGESGGGTGTYLEQPPTPESTAGVTRLRRLTRGRSEAAGLLRLEAIHGSAGRSCWVLRESKRGAGSFTMTTREFSVSSWSGLEQRRFLLEAHARTISRSTKNSYLVRILFSITHKFYRKQFNF
jgi:hypothetical protein